MLCHFAHLLRDEYGLTSSPQVDIYKKVGMFLCILAHGKGYRQVTTIFNYSLQTVCQFFKEVLCVIVLLSERIIRSAHDYNDGVEPHKPDPNKHPLFQDCIGAINETHVRAVLPRHKWVNFIGRKGIPTQDVLAACDFNLCFTFVLAGYTRNTHDARILARAIYSPEIEFPQLATGKYYLVDSDFAHQPGYMAPYKGSDILYHFQNVIKRAFGVLKQRSKILDRMPSYSFPTQVAVVLATMAIHNFLRHLGVVDEAFARAETDDNVAKVELPNVEDEIQVEVNAPEIQWNEWDRLRNYMMMAVRIIAQISLVN
ncbi:uncharacterized protein LOC111408523 [Olea europaea var. sylvestris]|uniref:uncharacterized protein LOC111408523 n=1 Tax=Olea europaea var. sylvestris TaxID=158386 RepID=UPI000C1CF707|nr:uncharacterized protein LOC111408523 [Olea europaea var. sylvestris]